MQNINDFFVGGKMIGAER